MRAAIVRFWVWLMLQCGIYYKWSRIYQRVVEGAYRKAGPIPKYESLQGLERFLGSMEWIKDGLLSLGDAIGSPKATYWRHKLGHKHRGLVGNDCDEFALYAADRVHDMALRGALAGEGVSYADVYLVTVTWMCDGRPGGHNVCAFRYVKPDGMPRWAHLSNWNGGQHVGGFMSLEDVVKDVLSGAGAGKCLGWAAATPELKPVLYGNGKGFV